MKAPRPGCLKTNCHNRPAFCLNNGVIKLTTLTGGGHIADFRLLGQTVASMNSLWEAPWPTMDPGRFRSSHVRKYGATSMGKFLAAFTGHAVCLDYFGEPSEEEAVRGLALHGEAANSRWKLLGRKQNNAEARLLLGVRLPAAGLRLRRDLSLRRNESVVYVEERLTNERTQDHFFHWIQHVTLGPPLLRPDESVVALPGSRGLTWPHGYEGRSLIRDNQEFTWPEAPALGGGKINLDRPFGRDGRGCVAAVLLDPRRQLGFIAALNWRLGLLLGYCFRRSDLGGPSGKRTLLALAPPWDGKMRAHGLEFGSTPMPICRGETFARGSQFDTPTFRRIPARSELRAPYVVFLSQVSSRGRSIRDLQPQQDRIVVTEERGEQLELQATGLKKMGIGSIDT
jgi:hypothetical protein